MPNHLSPVNIVIVLNSGSDMGRAWAFSAVERVIVDCGAACVTIAQRIA